MESALYTGSIAHQRFTPVAHKFRYSFFMWFFNLDELETLPPLGRLFSTKKWALSRFNRADYLGDPQQPLADSIRQRMQELTGQPVEGQVCGLLNLRTLGFYFSPVNFYYGYDRSENLTHFLAEVSNIPWNERYQYAHFVAGGHMQPTHAKEFHVSPFNSTNQRYNWILEEPGDEINVQLGVEDDRGQIFQAQLQLRRKPLNFSIVAKEIIKKPVMTFFIVAGIYWQAARLFMKGVPYIPYQKEMT